MLGLRTLTAVGLGVLALLAAVATEAGAQADTVTLQLKWVTQAQFAGYYARSGRWLGGSR